MLHKIEKIIFTRIIFLHNLFTYIYSSYFEINQN